MHIVEANSTPRVTALAGGVSSDIWRVDLPDRSICVKRALPRLKVAAEWNVPTIRSATEWDWLEHAARIVPGAVPGLIARDSESGCFAMEYLDPRKYPVWKAELHRGHVEIATAASVGALLVSIHHATADREELRTAFATDDIFYAIRLEPFLLATAERHPDLAAHLHLLAGETARTRRVLVHGDVSPKNILIGQNGPVFLDAECAWYGDPAFDLAFCLTHLFLKCLWTPAASQRFLLAGKHLSEAYLEGVTWEDRAAVERRTAALVPALLLARVDGKSPVEYLSTDDDRALVRRVARRLLVRPVSRLEAIRGLWDEEQQRVHAKPAKGTHEG